MDIITRIAEEMSLAPDSARKTAALLDDGNTIPFIARYRKEVTGGIDDQVLRKFSDRLTSLRELEQKRADILRLIGEQGALSPEIEKAIAAAETSAALDDIYRPFRPKRKTRASVAKEKGLEPLCDAIFLPGASEKALLSLAASLISTENAVPDEQAAVSGALDILAERMSDTAALRGRLRGLLKNTGVLVSRQKKKEDSVYAPYYKYTEAIRRVAGHRILALNRGEAEGFLTVSIETDDTLMLTHMTQAFPAAQGFATELVRTAAADSFKRLLLPSLTTEIRAELTERAEEEAMAVFAQNLRDLLMTPSMRGHTVLALDPAFRTGCKLAVIDVTGKPLYTGVIYPTPPQNKTEESAAALAQLAARFGVDIIAIGNGTASRETEKFVATAVREKAIAARWYMVNEAGASVYSASELAASEFPDLDLTRRSAISIGRRLQDPLAELVKIDPQSIGVGQYQHDMNPKRLSHTLDGVVESCVNEVGVDLNTASPSLLEHIAGISTPIARNIVAYRETAGRFTARAELAKVPRLGPKTFEQCAGFLRIDGGSEPLDATRIHPESYAAARAVLSHGKPYDLSSLSAQLNIGIPTLADIVAALENPGFDPRAELSQPEIREDVMEITDLREGMVLTGVVRNVSAFGAFVDIGVHQDGLVHVSELAERFVSNPIDVVRIGQTVRVRVLSVDAGKKRISLSMKRV